MRFSLSTVSTVLTALSFTSLASARCQRYLDAARLAGNNLQSGFFKNGGYEGQWVWISAVDATYLRRIDQVAGTGDYNYVMNTVFNGWEGQLNNGGSFDDVQWVAITYLQAGNVDLAKHYYDIANSAWENGYCGGGLFWSAARDYKNAITNELFVATSGYLFDVTKDGRYFDNARNAWNWLKNTRMRGDNGLFNDGLSREGQCNNNGGTQWTYNQGTILAGLGYLWKATLDETYIQDAWHIMDSIIDHMTVNGGLKEVCDDAEHTSCNADQQSFKGITMYYMAWFLDLTGRDNGSKYSDFIKQQADKVLANAVGPSPGWYTNLWYDGNRGGSTFTVATQGAAVGALTAAAMQNC